MPYSLTPAQADCVRVFAELYAAAGCAPNVGELARELSTGEANVVRLLNGLEERGWISRLPHRARGVRLLHPPPPWEHSEEHGLAVTAAGQRYLEAAERSHAP